MKYIQEDQMILTGNVQNVKYLINLYTFEEPLSKHFGHGSAKSSNNCSKK
jgi:hypothetical protein